MKLIIPIPSQDMLREFLTYENDTGKLFFNQREQRHFKSGAAGGQEASARRWNTRLAGKEAFTTKNNDGYMTGRLDAITYRAHRIIWKMEYGHDPFHIDHINHIRDDNRLSNLADADPISNGKNYSMHKANSSGFTGVDWDEARQQWRARIFTDKKERHLGRFYSKADAIEARKQANDHYNFHHNHGLKSAGADACFRNFKASNLDGES